MNPILSFVIMTALSFLFGAVVMFAVIFYMTAFGAAGGGSASENRTRNVLIAIVVAVGLALGFVTFSAAAGIGALFGTGLAALYCMRFIRSRRRR